MSSLEKPAGLAPLAGAKTERTPRTLQARFLELVEKVRQTRPASDIEVMRRAFEFAAEQHRAQQRQSGDPYLSHPLSGPHPGGHEARHHTLCAALLHDVVEDTRVSPARLSERFGRKSPVGGRRDENQPPRSSGAEARQAESVRKMLLAMVNDVRVVVVKLADRSTTCARWVFSRRRSSSALLARHWKFTRRLRTGSAWG